MFKQNKYTNWYFNIIDAAKKRQLIGYKERHHIVPKSLGGNNSIDNLVDLTPREHFIVHLLLIKMVDTHDVYKMIHAIIRFTKKVKNSKEYDLLKRYLSTYSKGEFNKSYNKIWARLKSTNEIIYIDKRQFDSNIHLKGPGKQRGGFSDYKWINNTLSEKLIPAAEPVPNDWVIGRITTPETSHMKAMAKNRHTPEKDLEHSNKLKGANHFNFGKPAFNKGRKWVNDGHISKMVSNDLLDAMLNTGWSLGRLQT